MSLVPTTSPFYYHCLPRKPVIDMGDHIGGELILAFLVEMCMRVDGHLCIDKQDRPTLFVSSIIS